MASDEENMNSEEVRVIIIIIIIILETNIYHFNFYPPLFCVVNILF